MSNNKEPNKLRAVRYDFWTRIIEYSSNSKITILKIKMLTLIIGWLYLLVQVRLIWRLNNKWHYIEICFYISDNKEIYEDIVSYKDEIDPEVKYESIWKNPQETKRKKLFLKSQD